MNSHRACRWVILILVIVVNRRWKLQWKDKMENFKKRNHLYWNYFAEIEENYSSRDFIPFFPESNNIIENEIIL